MLNKRGQVTGFIIIGVIILLTLFVLFYYPGEDDVERISKLPSDIRPVQGYIDDCVKDAADDGITFISLQGGYYELPELSIDMTFIEVPYYFYLGDADIPLKSVVEEELSKYIEVNY